ncbi:hypothetical protein GWK47_040485 [Chionoecetes opilio]|uniref:Uncharacterized protein n=1 Tax=Chionoecetes opilio TaxID=41210 RepID=A0A8J4YAP1_CHIOP|nr:hypothetical protein GWK47_040485 [Chionoecetes opilio]
MKEPGEPQANKPPHQSSAEHAPLRQGKNFFPPPRTLLISSPFPCPPTLGSGRKRNRRQGCRRTRDFASSRHSRARVALTPSPSTSGAQRRGKQRQFLPNLCGPHRHNTPGLEGFPFPAQAGHNEGKSPDTRGTEGGGERARRRPAGGGFVVAVTRNE